jgi:hypothetical protein
MQVLLRRRLTDCLDGTKHNEQVGTGVLEAEERFPDGQNLDTQFLTQLPACGVFGALTVA